MAITEKNAKDILRDWHFIQNLQKDLSGGRRFFSKKNGMFCIEVFTTTGTSKIFNFNTANECLAFIHSIERKRNYAFFEFR